MKLVKNIDCFQMVENIAYYYLKCLIILPNAFQIFNFLFFQDMLTNPDNLSKTISAAISAEKDHKNNNV